MALFDVANHEDPLMATRERHSDLVSGPNRGLEAPVDFQKDRPRPREVLRHEGVEDGAGHAPLHDDLAEARRFASDSGG